MSRSRKITVLATAGAACLIAAGCSTSSVGGTTSSDTTTAGQSGSSSKSAGGFTACLVSGTGGVNDRGFNQSAWEGTQSAVSALKLPSGDAKVLQPQTNADYTPDIQAFIGQKCSIIVTEGFDALDATEQAAKANPNQKFAIIDATLDKPLSNVAELVFDSAEASFIGGYAAAAISRSKTVGEFGGIASPPVNTWMDGFAGGVAYYNQKNNASVKVVGWDVKSQKGLYSGTYSDQSKGLQLAQQLQSQGADVIFPVAGNVNLGAARAAVNGHFSILWSDTNGCQAAANYCNVFLGSATKNVGNAVAGIVTATHNGTFKGGSVVGTFANKGLTFIVGSGTAGKQLSGQLKTALTQVQQGIEAGSIKIESPDAPAK